MVVNQEELKILRLTHSIMTDDELRTHEANLNYAFDLKTNAKVTVLKHKRRKTLKICRKTLGEFQGAASGGRWCRLPYANGVVLSVVINVLTFRWMSSSHLSVCLYKSQNLKARLVSLSHVSWWNSRSFALKCRLNFPLPCFCNFEHPRSVKGLKKCAVSGAVASFRCLEPIDDPNEISIKLRHMNDVSGADLQAQSAEREAEVRHMVEEYREVYDSVVAEDKMLDRGFKRDFSDVPLSLTDQLYKLFKRRPRLVIDLSFTIRTFL